MVFNISPKISNSRTLSTSERNHAFSTMLRIGANMEIALWVPGYRGRSQSLQVVYNPEGLRLKK
ncbi:MAG: hypothetical protein WBL92_05120, partial [Methanothrix sp.]